MKPRQPSHRAARLGSFLGVAALAVVAALVWDGAHHPKRSGSAAVSSSPRDRSASARPGPVSPTTTSPRGMAGALDRDRRVAPVVTEETRIADGAIDASMLSAARRDALNAQFFGWALRDPDDAMRAARQLPSPAERRYAIESALSGWAHVAPDELAEAALSFSDDAEKSAGETKALRIWLVVDPWTAGDWIMAHHEILPVAESIFRDENR